GGGRGEGRGGGGAGRGGGHRRSPARPARRTAGRGQQSFGQKSGPGRSEPSEDTGPARPRRSDTNSVIMETKRGSVAGVAARAIGRPSLRARLALSLSTP